MKTLDIGQPASFTAEVTDRKGDPVDPDNPIWRVLEPSGELAEPSMTRVSTGVFEGEFDHKEDGVHRLLYRGDPPHKTGKEVAWRVKVPKVPRD